MGTQSVLFKFRFMENSSNRQYYNFGVWHRRIPGKLIQNRACSQKMTFKEFRHVTQTDIWKNWKVTHEKLMVEFSSNRSSSLEFRKKYWMSFPEKGLCHNPDNWNFGKISGWVFRDLPIRVKYLYTWLSFNRTRSTGSWLWKDEIILNEVILKN